MYKQFLSTSTNHLKMAIIVRTDLKMGKGKIASQCAHAAVTLSQNAATTNRNLLNQWLVQGQAKVVLKIDKDCENIMRNLYDKSISLGINACMVCDAGRTQISKGTLTVIGVGPDWAETINEITKDIKLL